VEHKIITFVFLCNDSSQAKYHRSISSYLFYVYLFSQQGTELLETEEEEEEEEEGRRRKFHL